MKRQCTVGLVLLMLPLVTWARGIQAGNENVRLENLEKTGYAEVGVYSVEKRSPNYEVYHIHDGTLARPGETDVWNPSSIHVIVGNTRALIIDASNARPEERANLRKITDYLIKGKPYDVAITHNHGDHTGQIPAFTESRYGIPAQHIYYPVHDASSTISNNPLYTLIKEGDIINLGNFAFTAQEISAHTTGSMGYFDAEHELVATGDAIGSAHVWLFNPHIVPQFIREVDRFLNSPALHPIKDWSDKAVLMLGHDWQRWEHAFAKNDILTVEFYKRQKELAEKLVQLPQTELIGEAYPNMRGRIGYRFRDPTRSDMANLIDIPIDNGVGPVHFTELSRQDFDYDAAKNGYTNYFITFKQLEGFYLIRDHNIDSMYLFISGDDTTGEAFLIDASNGAPNYTGFAEYVKGKIGNRSLKIFITHAHGDHYGQLRFFTPQLFPKMTLYWPKYENLILPATGNVSETSALGHIAAAGGISLNDRTALTNLSNKLNTERVKFVSEGDIFYAAGKHFEVIRMRVHTAGGEMLLDVEDRIVFSGDALGTQTTTGGIWVNNGPTIQFTIDEFSDFRNRYGYRFDKIYTGHNSYYVDPSYVAYAIATAKALKSEGYKIARFNVPEGRPNRIMVMSVDGQIRTDNDAIDANRTGTLSAREEYNSASLDFPPFRTDSSYGQGRRYLLSDVPGTILDVPVTGVPGYTASGHSSLTDGTAYWDNNYSGNTSSPSGATWSSDPSAADTDAKAAAQAYTDQFDTSANNPPTY
ncbi:hypothetical protein FACS1894172_10880 [Spirochaetia bacterium]|nr:hypothetical protein FACS1894164_18980 [Spirochaetia bacterium]GHU33073.1 hypothetical protein FACS1894172_10880 [Spirochaetia bacterium]